MAQQIMHTGFVVENKERAVAFYRDVVGLRVISEYERQGDAIDKVLGYADVHLKSAILDMREGHVLELFQYVIPPPAARPTPERNVVGAAHMAFQVDDIQEAYARWTTGGATALEEPQQIVPGRWICYLQDPDGNWMELVQVD